MSQIAISLPDDLQSFVTEAVRSGRYSSEGEFVLNMLYQVKEQEEQAPLDMDSLSAEEKETLNALREDVRLGLDQLERGEGVRDLNWDAFIREMHQERDASKPA